jgi:hypothetical protein
MQYPCLHTNTASLHKQCTNTWLSEGRSVLQKTCPCDDGNEHISSVPITDAQRLSCPLKHSDLWMHRSSWCQSYETQRWVGQSWNPGTPHSCSQYTCFRIQISSEKHVFSVVFLTCIACCSRRRYHRKYLCSGLALERLRRPLASHCNCFVH